MPIGRRLSPRRFSQRAPFAGAGANVQNRALSGALSQAPQQDPVQAPEPVVEPQPEPEVQAAPAPAVKARAAGPKPMRSTVAPSAPYAGIAATAPSMGGAIAGPRGEVTDAYKRFTGREATEEEIGSHLSGAGSPIEQGSAAVRNIYNSPEAAAYRNLPGGGRHRELNPPGQPATPGGVGLPPGLGAALTGSGQAPAGPTPGDPSTYGMPQGQWDREYRWTGDPSLVTSIPRGNFGYLTGYDQGKFDSDHNTMKYVFGRIASNYDPTQAGSLDAMMADPAFKAAFPNAVKVGDNDKIDFGDGRPVDVWRNHGAGAGGGGDAWAWQTMDQAHMGGGGAAAGGAMPGVPGGNPLTSGTVAGGDDFVQKLLAYLTGQLQI